MKKILFIILAVSSFAACKKNKVSPRISVVGKWELHRRFGGNILPQDTTFQPGNGNILQFNADSTYKNYYQGTLTGQGSFRIVKGAYKENGQTYDELYFINNAEYNIATIPDIVTVSGGVLTLKPAMDDAGTMQYNKLAN